MFLIIGIAALVVLVHTAPFPFLLDVTDRTIWQMPQDEPPTVYLTIDDGPNPTATGDLLDVLARHDARATFFVIDKHLTEETAPLVRRAFEEGHAVGLHSHTRWLMLKTPGRFARSLEQAATRMQTLTGHRPCRAFRPHGGNRSAMMIAGAGRAGYRVIGWGWMLWDFNWFRERTSDALVPRLADRASAGDIIVIHDGHHDNPGADRRYAVETVDRLVPELRSRGFELGVICPAS